MTIPPEQQSDARFLANYAYINLNDPLTRLPGIGNVQIFGARHYAMRLCVNPDRIPKIAKAPIILTKARQLKNNPRRPEPGTI